MPLYMTGTDEPKVSLTEPEQALVRASIYGNIAALHFDGQVLAEMVYAHRQIANAERVR